MGQLALKRFDFSDICLFRISHLYSTAQNKVVVTAIAEGAVK